MSPAGVAPRSNRPGEQPPFANDDELVRRARREISEIVREVAILARQPIDQKAFFTALIDRTVCAIAAEGAVLWSLQHPAPVAVSRTGRASDLTIPKSGIASHECVLREVGKNLSPVVVPSTPGACDPGIPANASEFPIAVVPIVDLAASGDSPSASPFILEVFLESEAGAATQRGYLRFIAQMADLASEFLRNDEIRSGRTRVTLQSQAMRSLSRMHELETSSAVAAEIVDSAAAMFDADRATLASFRSGRSRLLAISHVDTIDHRGRACRNLAREVAAISLPATADAHFEGDHSSIPSEPKNRSQTTAPRKTHHEQPLESSEHSTQSDDANLVPAGLLRNRSDSLRLYLQDAAPKSRTDTTRQVLTEWAEQAFSILEARQRFESVPLAKAYIALSPALLSVAPSSTRRIVTFLAATIVLGMLAMIPTPMIVSVPATLRPAEVRTHYAPSDVIVESIAVKHGEQVTTGQLLMQLRDWNLDEQIATLNARRGVLTQRLARSLSSLVQAPERQSYSIDRRNAASDEDLVQQQRLLEEELLGIDEQLELLNASRDRLKVYAQCDGRIDAWQAELTAQGRPVKRGESLIRVEPLEAKWMADARVPQSRLSAVMERFQKSPETLATVSSIAKPEKQYLARFVRREEIIVPREESVTEGLGVTETSLGIELQVQVDSTGDKLHHEDSWVHGTPATVTIDCGSMPLAKVMFFDLLRAARRTFSRWI